MRFRVVRWAVVGCGAALGVWDSRAGHARDAWLREARHNFQPGSAEETVADSLQSGDVLLFARDPFTLSCCHAITASCYHQLHKDPFDSCAIVCQNRFGEPFLLERTSAGVALRPYARRVLTSMATQILAVRVPGTRSDQQKKALWEVAQGMVRESGAEPPPYVPGKKQQARQEKQALLTSPEIDPQHEYAVLFRRVGLDAWVQLLLRSVYLLTGLAEHPSCHHMALVTSAFRAMGLKVTQPEDPGALDCAAIARHEVVLNGTLSLTSEVVVRMRPRGGAPKSH